MQSLAKAIKYIKSPDELLATLRRGSLTSDLVLPNTVFTGAQTVKYQHIDFGSYELGSYSTAGGYTQTKIVATWKDLVLTQDKGNALIIDKFEDEEAMANGLVTYVNRYILDVQAPALDTYRFGVIAGKSGILFKKATLSNSTVLGAVLDAFALMNDNGINTDSGMILYVSPTVDKWLGEAALGKGYITMGSWNNSVDTNVVKFNEAKKVVVPSARLGAGVQFILLHKNAVAAFEKYRETVYFDQIPGHGGRKAEADVGVYHECFVYDELVNAVYVSKAATHKISFDDNDQTSVKTMADITGIAEGRSVKLPLCTLAATGYTFKGWDTTAYNAASHSTPEVVYEDGAIVTMSTADITLYAVWEQVASG